MSSVEGVSGHNHVLSGSLTQTRGEVRQATLDAINGNEYTSYDADRTAALHTSQASLVEVGSSKENITLQLDSSQQ